jgi:hypothetical protein
MAATIEESWVMMDDFNEIANLNEKKGGVQVDIRKCQNFNNRINECRLMEDFNGILHMDAVVSQVSMTLVEPAVLCFIGSLLLLRKSLQWFNPSLFQIDSCDLS